MASNKKSKRITLRISTKAMNEYLRRKYGIHRSESAIQIIMGAINEYEELAESQKGKVNLSITIGEESYEDLKRRAGENGCSASEFVSACLEKANDHRNGLL